MLPAYHTQTIKVIETMAIHDYRIDAKQLMERAGQAALQVLVGYWPAKKSIVVFCGKGNNGGDGYVLARLAAQQGYTVTIRYLGELAQLPHPAQEAAQACLDAGIEVKPVDHNETFVDCLLIDALLGIGVEGEVKDEVAQVIQQLNQSANPIFALDIPSGLSADTGAVLGHAIQAEVTLSFIGYKRGLFTGAAVAHVGKLFLDRLELPSLLFDAIKPDAWVMDVRDIGGLLPRRPRDAHKGLFGHVAILGGNHTMAGAARMAAEAAARAGAGLVSVITRPEHINGLLTACPEVMGYGCNKPKKLKSLLQRATVVVVGPGLGQDRWARACLKLALQQKKPLILDADALNLLAKKPKQNDHWILTPHPGEAARLLNVTVAEIQRDRFTAAQRLQKTYGGCIVLKGAGTIVQSAQEVPIVNQTGNAGMASGGMGDLLSGLIAGLLAQGLTSEQAAQKAVLIHGRAADLAVLHQGERGLLATDLLPFIRRLVNAEPLAQV